MRRPTTLRDKHAGFKWSINLNVGHSLPSSMRLQWEAWHRQALLYASVTNVRLVMNN